MDLLEQYQTLVGRGMPLHPRLRHSAGRWDCGGFLLDDEDARDMISHYALRWWGVADGDNLYDGPVWYLYIGDHPFNVEILDSEAMPVSDHKADLLAAIIAATAYINPTQRSPNDKDQG